MPSNQHFGVDILDIHVGPDRPFRAREFLEAVDESPSGLLNPFGDTMKSQVLVGFDSRQWLSKSTEKSVNLQSVGQRVEGSQFEFSFRFDAAIYLSEIDVSKFSYSLASKLTGSTILGKRLKQRLGYRDGSYEIVVAIEEPHEGSIHQKLGVAILTAGSFIGFYPELKDGFREIYADVQWLSSKVETALRSAKLPVDPTEGNEKRLAIIEKRREMNRERDE